MKPSLVSTMSKCSQSSAGLFQHRIVQALTKHRSIDPKTTHRGVVSPGLARLAIAGFPPSSTTAKPLFGYQGPRFADYVPWEVRSDCFMREPGALRQAIRPQRAGGQKTWLLYAKLAGLKAERLLDIYIDHPLRLTTERTLCLSPSSFLSQRPVDTFEKPPR